MLENQIPLFVSRRILEFQFTSLEQADDLLISMLMGLCKELSPFKVVDQDLPKIQVSECAHLLDFLYQMITPKLERRPSEIVEAEDEGESTPHKGSESSDSLNFVKQFLQEVGKLLSKLNKGPVRLLKKLLVSGPVKVFFKLPWTILSNLPGFAMLKQPVSYLFSTQAKEETNPKNENSGNSISKPPLVEEITIPSVSDLVKSGVRFVKTKGSPSTISVDPKTVTFYLPATTRDVNTEVILRNLVAYEVSNASGPLVLTRYTELMNGIIDTEEDVKLLKEKGIILNHLKSDEKVKMKKFMKVYVFGSWQFLAVLAGVLLLLLMTLQAFCSVYSCSRVFHITTTTT